MPSNATGTDAKRALWLTTIVTATSTWAADEKRGPVFNNKDDAESYAMLVDRVTNGNRGCRVEMLELGNVDWIGSLQKLADDYEVTLKLTPTLLRDIKDAKQAAEAAKESMEHLLDSAVPYPNE